MARAALEAGRVAIAAQSLGVGHAALDQALAHAKARQTFGRPIAKYQAVQWFLADIEQCGGGGAEKRRCFSCVLLC